MPRRLAPHIIVALLCVYAAPSFGDVSPILVRALSTTVTCHAGETDILVPSSAEVLLREPFTATTDARGSALVVFPDSARILIRPNTTVEVGPGSLAVLRGDSWMRFTKRGRDFKIRTPHGQLAIRGTLFSLGVNTAGTEVRLLEGGLVVAAGGRATLLAAGKLAQVDGRTCAVVIRPLPRDVLERYRIEAAPFVDGDRAGGVRPSLLDETLMRETGRGVDVDRMMELEDRGFGDTMRTD